MHFGYCSENNRGNYEITNKDAYLSSTNCIYRTINYNTFSV